MRIIGIMRPLPVFATLLLAIVVAACTGAEPPALGEPRPVALPAGTNVVGPRFAAATDGTIVLSWMQRNETGATFRFSTLENDKWQKPATVVTDGNMFVNWADLPSVTPLRREHWVAHWLSKSAEATYAYDVLLSRSADSGMTWSDPVRPHNDGTPTEHGFVSIYAEGDSAALLWLDGRKTGDKVSDNPADSSMTLRSAIVAPQGTLSKEQLVDEIVCDCCQTDVAISSAGPIAVYRNRTVDEIRDIYMTKWTDGQWQNGVPVANDGWKISGCPVNGPAIDASGDFVVVAWFSAAGAKPVVRAVLSTDGGKTFKNPIEIASRHSSGHVGVAIVDESAAAISWVESDNRGTNAINIRSVTAAGLLGPVHTVGRSELVRIVPQIARSHDKLIIAWTDEINDTTEIVSVKVPILGFYDR